MQTRQIALSRDVKRDARVPALQHLALGGLPRHVNRGFLRAALRGLCDRFRSLFRAFTFADGQCGIAVIFCLRGRVVSMGRFDVVWLLIGCILFCAACM